MDAQDQRVVDELSMVATLAVALVSSQPKVETLVEPQNYRRMTVPELKAAVQRIIRISDDEAEIKHRLYAELEITGAALCCHKPEDKVGREARGFVMALGGLITRQGAMVMIMFHGPRGETISL